MKPRVVMFLLGILVSTTLFAAAKRSEKALKTSINEEGLTAELAAGHHFNDKAPNGLQLGNDFFSPTQFSKQKIEIKKENLKKSSGEAYFYVCDDEVTYCEMHTVALGKAESHKQTKQNKISDKIKHGFLQNDFDGALALARKEKKMLIVDFGARWCPACLRLEKEILSKRSFSQRTKNFIKVKIDGDLFTHAPIMEKYQVKGYPTILFLTTEGEEIIRFMDYQPMAVVEQFIQHSLDFPISISQLETAERNEKILAGLWKRYYYSGQMEKSLSVMEQLKEKPTEYWSARVELAKSKNDNSKELLSTLKAALAVENQSTRSQSWRALLIQNLKDGNEEIQKLVDEAQKLTNTWLANPESLRLATQTDTLGEFTGFEKFYVALLNADVMQSANWKTEEAWKLTVDIGLKSNITAKQPGASLRLFNAMMQAKEYQKALQVIDGMLTLSKNDGDLLRRKMRVLMELNRHSEAIEFGQRALKNSYGRNEFEVAVPLAKAYLAVGKIQIARQLIEQYLTKNEINFNRMSKLKSELLEMQKQIK